MSHIGYMIFDTQLDRQMNLRDVRRDGRIDSETEFERHWCKHRTGAEKEINPETESAVREFVDKYPPLREKQFGGNYWGQGRGFTNGRGLVGGTRKWYLFWRLASRAQQRQRSRLRYFGGQP